MKHLLYTSTLILGLAVAPSAGPRSAAAQPEAAPWPSLIADERIRVTAPNLVGELDAALFASKRTSLMTSEPVLYGTLVDVNADQLTMIVDGSTTTVIDIPLSEIRSVDVGSLSTHKATGALIGALSGGFIGSLMGSSVKKEKCDDCWLFDPSSEFEYGFWGVVIGAGVGGLLGSLVPSIHWVPIEHESRGLSVGLHGDVPASLSASLKW